MAHNLARNLACNVARNLARTRVCTAIWGAGVNVDSPAGWLQLVQWDPFIKLAPAVVSTLLLMLVMARLKSPLALPAVLVFLPGVFFVVLVCLHKSLVDAQDGGWVAKPAVRLCCLKLKWVTLAYCMCLSCQAEATEGHARLL